MSDTNLTALEKRIKRRICARRHVFFAVVTPGLEGVCTREIEGLPGSFEIISPESGGISFAAGLSDAYAANLFLRTPTRILMRVHGFSASSFIQFEKEFRKIPWELFLREGSCPEVSVSCSKCRLYHSDAIAERSRKWFSEILGPVDLSRKKQQIFIRGEDDRFTLSINTSGDPLYKRGLKEGGGLAPIRETLASGILDMAGFREGMTLLDPMCGSGTFSLEAAMISKRIPPGFYRDFAFTDWPSFMEKRWRHMLIKASEEIIPCGLKTIFASDVDSQTTEFLKRNIEKSDLRDIVSVCRRDFFETREIDLPREKGLVVFNPPYGKRLGNVFQGRRYFEDICGKLASDFMGWRIAVIAPGEFFNKDMPFREMRLHDVFHGGLKLKVLTAKI